MELLLVLAILTREHIYHLYNKINAFCRSIYLFLRHYIAFSENTCFILYDYLSLLATILKNRLVDDDLLSRFQDNLERHSSDFLPILPK